MKFHIKSKKIESMTYFLKENKTTLLTLFVVFIFADIFFANRSSDLVIITILLLYGILIKTFHIKSRFTFLLCLALLMAMSIDYLLTSASISTEKAAVWLILFLGIGAIQQWRE